MWLTLCHWWAKQDHPNYPVKFFIEHKLPNLFLTVISFWKFKSENYRSCCTFFAQSSTTQQLNRCPLMFLIPFTCLCNHSLSHMSQNLLWKDALRFKSKTLCALFHTLIWPELIDVHGQISLPVHVTDAAKMLMLLMRWCCWCNVAADALLLLMRWCCCCADATKVLMLLMHCCC